VHDRGSSRVMCEKISAALKVLAGLETSPDQIEKLRECSEWQREDVELWDLARVMFLLRGLGLTPTVKLSELVYAAVLEAYMEGFELEPLRSAGAEGSGVQAGAPHERRQLRSSQAKV
jgi:hypothetical protein